MTTEKEDFLHIPFPTALLTYFGYGLILFYGQVRDLLGSITGSTTKAKTKPGYAPITQGAEDFYTRRLYHRINDCWNRPICSAPGRVIDVIDRERISSDSKDLRFPGTTRTCINLGSYNYLGFADDWHDGPCSQDVYAALERYGPSTASTATDIGTTPVHEELEALVAEFVGKPAAMVYAMGFGTNSTTIPALFESGTLLVSDSLNHASIVTGCRNSGAKIRVFKHGDYDHLESVIRDAIISGQPKTGRAWKKIMIMVEGIYSMEGEICDLAKVVAIKKKYKCYLYVDEAHSIGALGYTGKGVCEHRGVDPADVDILMGTFTKSFGSIGGYVAGSKDLITFLKSTSAGYVYGNNLSVPCAQQIISAIHVITGRDGSDIGRRKLDQLRENSNYFRAKLREIGCQIGGDDDSPVVPVMLFAPGKIAAFSREAFKRNVAVVVVGFPATPVLLARVRFCLSAAHTREDLDQALEAIGQCARRVHILYRFSALG
eukprot:GILK01001037.1.p1 GENE.GILK01001037.1~~GILK01001037.1.p1  ORF type:complete len:512 (-),score=65.23 GILK01001037.1:149-1615(-)